jgi:hypothetical protein
MKTRKQKVKTAYSSRKQLKTLTANSFLTYMCTFIFAFLHETSKFFFLTSNNNNNVYFKSLSYTNVLFKLEMNAQQNKIF